jgi:hypothetical protein
MAVTKIDLINFALALVGEKDINSTTDPVKAAELANSLWEVVVFRLFDLPYVNWKFATTRTTLSELSDTPAFGYDHQYQYPDNCRRITGMLNEDDDTIEFEWRRELYIDDDDNEYDVVATNEDTVRVKYIFYREDCAKWPGWFGVLVATGVAVVLSEPLKQDKKHREQLRDMMAVAMAEAMAGNQGEDVDVNADNERLDDGNTDVVNAAVAGFLGPDWSNWGRRRVL